MTLYNRWIVSVVICEVQDLTLVLLYVHLNIIGEVQMTVIQNHTTLNYSHYARHTW